ncbi:ArsR/SmtB family transcription factor [Arthrobacter rhombi]|uniref:ArsR/SmtB family transcription factor n=1 Tax=Arthrobacter rhombi TaxID=71253 RepID=UPI003FD2989C
MPRRTKDAPLDKVFGALSNPTRRDVLAALLAGRQTAGELATRFDMSRPSVSGHLRALRESQMIVEQPEGRHIYYAIAGDWLTDVTDWLTPYERFWRARLAALGDVLDGMPDEQ